MRGGLTITAAAPGGLAPRRLYSMQVAQSLGGGAGDDRHAPVDAWPMTVSSTSRALGFVEPGDFARDAEGRQAVDAGVNEEVDDAAQTCRVDTALEDRTA